MTQDLVSWQRLQEIVFRWHLEAWKKQCPTLSKLEIPELLWQALGKEIKIQRN